MQKIRDRMNDVSIDSKLFTDFYEGILIRTEINANYFKNTFGHVSVGNKYPKEENIHWTASFFVGMTQLAYAETKDSRYLTYSNSYINSFEEKLKMQHLDHDLGFLYSLSCVAIYKNTGNEKAKMIALRAADELIRRFNDRGNYIQAWKPIGVGVGEVKIIIDSMLNLPLLYWATTATGDEKYAEIAKKHAETSSLTLMREDYSVYHTYLFDPVSGRAISGRTHQGKYDESTWARGQAWALYGFALSYLYTEDEYFLEKAMGAAVYYINNLPEDYIHYWDFSATDMAPEMKDSSAASIGASGLLLLSKLTNGECSSTYEKYGKIIIAQLIENYYIVTNEPGVGLLREGYYRSKDYNECTIWGDYFFVEALFRIKNSENKYIFW